MCGLKAKNQQYGHQETTKCNATQGLPPSWPSLEQALRISATWSGTEATSARRGTRARTKTYPPSAETISNCGPAWFRHQFELQQRFVCMFTVFHSVGDVVVFVLKCKSVCCCLLVSDFCVLLMFPKSACLWCCCGCFELQERLCLIAVFKCVSILFAFYICFNIPDFMVLLCLF